MLTLGKRLATQDYWVYSIDLTSHGESKEQINLARSSTYIHFTAKWFRANGIKNVGVIGHSLGAVVTLFALTGYNTRIENAFYSTMARFESVVTEAVEHAKAKQLENPREFVYNIMRSNQDFKNLKKMTLQGLKRMMKGRSKINAAVILSAPLKIQLVLPPTFAKLLKKRRVAWAFGKIFNKGWNLAYMIMNGMNTKKERSLAGKGEISIGGAVIRDTEATFEYAINVKNPYDYINYIDFLGDEDKHPDTYTPYFKYFRNLIRKVPKLYIFSLKDELLKPLKGNMLPDLKKHYKSFGETDIVTYANLMHSLNKEGLNYQFEGVKFPPITQKIVTFLNRYLGGGKPLPLTQQQIEANEFVRTQAKRDRNAG